MKLENKTPKIQPRSYQPLHQPLGDIESKTSDFHAQFAKQRGNFSTSLQNRQMHLKMKLKSE
jgi:hypothetical protein